MPTMPLSSIQPFGLASALVALFAASAPADDWPQWRGPDRDGISRETGLLREWPDGGPPLARMSREVGLGYGGPAVVGDRLYMLGTRDGSEQLFAIDVSEGRVVWAAPLGGVYENDWGDGPRGTPTVVGDRVYALGGEGTLVCVSATDGSEHWRVTMQSLGGATPTWGYAESPLVDSGRVIVTPGGDAGAIAALDAETGDTLWRAEALDDGAHYASVVIAQPHGRRHYAHLLPNRIVGLDPASGNLLWQQPWPGKVAVIPTPIVRDDSVYVTSGYGVGCLRVTLDHELTPELAYDNRQMKNHHGGALLLGDHVYGHSDRVGWLCQDFESGERVWRERKALGKGAIAYADGRFYCLAEQTGEVVLIAASPDGWQERGRFTLSPQTEQRKPKGKIWTHPVIANGRLYLRDQELLFAFDIAADEG